jgi:hypothetical protein
VIFGTLTCITVMSSQVNQVITGYHEIYIYSCLIGHVFYCHFFCNFSILLSGSRWPTCVRGWQCEIFEILADFCCLETEIFDISMIAWHTDWNIVEQRQSVACGCFLSCMKTVMIFAG